MFGSAKHIELLGECSWPRLLLMWLSLVTCFNWATYHWVVAPLRDQHRWLDQEIELMHTEQKDMMARIQSWQSNRDSLQELEAILTPLTIQQQELAGKDWLGVITQIAQTQQVEIVQLAWIGQAHRSESPTAQKIGFHVQGTYLALGYFYAQLLTLTHSVQFEQLEWQSGHEPLRMQSQGIVLIDRI